MEKISVIHRRLFRLVSKICLNNNNHTCEICGVKKKKMDVHHLMSRLNKNSPLKFDLRNLICLCPLCHKFGRYSAHKHGLWFAREFYKIRPKDYQYIINHTKDEVDLNNRKILKKLEHYLEQKNYKVLKEYTEIVCGRLRHIKEVDFVPLIDDMEDDILYRPNSKYYK